MAFTKLKQWFRRIVVEETQKAVTLLNLESTINKYFEDEKAALVAHVAGVENTLRLDLSKIQNNEAGRFKEAAHMQVQSLLVDLEMHIQQRLTEHVKRYEAAIQHKIKEATRTDVTCWRASAKDVEADNKLKDIK